MGHHEEESRPVSGSVGARLTWAPFTPDSLRLMWGRGDGPRERKQVGCVPSDLLNKGVLPQHQFWDRVTACSRGGAAEPWGCFPATPSSTKPVRGLPTPTWHSQCPCGTGGTERPHQTRWAVGTANTSECSVFLPEGGVSRAPGYAGNKATASQPGSCMSWTRGEDLGVALLCAAPAPWVPAVVCWSLPLAPTSQQRNESAGSRGRSWP